MAQPIACDICGEENAVQLLNNLANGDSTAIGPACLPTFYGQGTLVLMEAGEHKGLPQKCQACRRVHEKMTLAARPAPPAAEAPEPPADDQAAAAAEEAEG